MIKIDIAFIDAADKIEKATRIWREKQTNQYSDAVRLLHEAKETRDNIARKLENSDQR